MKQDSDTRAKDALVAMVAHELRNCLSSIKHGIVLLQKRSKAAELQPELDELERRAVHFGRLIEDLLDASVMLSGYTKLNRRRLSLNAVIGHAAGTVGSIMHEKRQHLDLQVPAKPETFIDGDPIRLEQVLVNLLMNAAKYSEPEDTIVVTMRRRDGEVRIEVRDYGVGIAPDELPRVFEPFYRGGQSREAGYGIGLSVARRLVELHGGTITAQSDGPGHGSRFTIRLPS